MKINEVRREDDYYLNGLYWVVADSYSDILRGNYKIIGTKYYVDYEGNEKESDSMSYTHQDAWKDFGKKYPGKDYDYFPRGRANIYKGQLYINTNSKVSNDNIISDVLDFYELDGFKPIITCNDKGPEGSARHYKFDLE